MTSFPYRIQLHSKHIDSNRPEPCGSSNAGILLFTIVSIDLWSEENHNPRSPLTYIHSFLQRISCCCILTGKINMLFVEHWMESEPLSVLKYFYPLKIVDESDILHLKISVLSSRSSHSRAWLSCLTNAAARGLSSYKNATALTSESWPFSICTVARSSDLRAWLSCLTMLEALLICGYAHLVLDHEFHITCDMCNIGQNPQKLVVGYLVSDPKFSLTYSLQSVHYKRTKTNPRSLPISEPPNCWTAEAVMLSLPDKTSSRKWRWLQSSIFL